MSNNNIDEISESEGSTRPVELNHVEKTPGTGNSMTKLSAEFVDICQ